MKYFSWILTAPLTLVVVVFAIANRQSVTLDLWPLELTAALPLSVLVLGALVLGFLAGASVMWVSAGKTRQRARSSRKEATKLKRKVESLEQVAGSGAPAGGVPARGSAIVPSPPGGRGQPIA